MRIKAEKYLGVPPLFLVEHPQGNLLMRQAFDAMNIDHTAEEQAIAIAKTRAEQQARMK